MRILSVGLAILLIGGTFLAANSFFIVDQREQALILQFGDPVAVYNAVKVEEDTLSNRPDSPNLEVTDAPGLKFKIPFIQRVIRYDRRTLDYDADPREILTAEREPLTVDAFLRFRIVDPLQFYRRVQTELQAISRLEDQLLSSLRDVLAGVETQAIVSGERAQLMEQVREAMRANARTLGIDIVDVRIRRVDLPETLSKSVYQRMESERRQVANRARAEGEETKRRIIAEADREVEILLAQAREEAEKIRGRGDARRADIFAQAYGRDPQFFAFYRSLIAYERALRDGETTMVLSPNSEFFQFFKEMEPPEGG